MRELSRFESKWVSGSGGELDSYKEYMTLFAVDSWSPETKVSVGTFLALVGGFAGGIWGSGYGSIYTPLGALGGAALAAFGLPLANKLVKEGYSYLGVI